MWTYEYVNEQEIPGRWLKTLIVFLDGEQISRETVKMATHDPVVWEQFALDFINFLQNNN
jgi:hypothetical protein